jgi:hypothetical protein
MRLCRTILATAASSDILYHRKYIAIRSIAQKFLGRLFTKRREKKGAFLQKRREKKKKMKKN